MSVRLPHNHVPKIDSLPLFNRLHNNQAISRTHPYLHRLQLFLVSLQLLSLSNSAPVVKTKFSWHFSQRPAYSFDCEADAACPVCNVQSCPFLIPVTVPVPTTYSYYIYSLCRGFRSQLCCPVQATYAAAIVRKSV